MRDRIEQLINSSPIFIFIKGTKLWPQCGFSGRVIDLLNHYEVDYETFDILSDDDLRQAVKEYTDWPTYPQIYVNGEFVGGCDILMQLHEQDELTKILKPEQEWST